MSEPKRYEVNGCIDCPFVGYDEEDERDICLVTGDETVTDGGDVPKWCPLIQRDVLVVLR